VRAGWTHHERDGGYIYTFARTDVPDYFQNQTDLSNDPNTSVARTDIVSGQADYALSDKLTLTGVLTWLRAKEDSASDGDFGPTTLAFSNRTVVSEQATQEVRLAYKGERLNGLIGVYHSQLEETDDYVNRVTVPLPTSTIVSALRAPPSLGGAGLSLGQATLVAGAYAAQLPAVPVNQTATNPVDIETTALFADGSFALTDQLSLLAGFRWDNESNETGGSQVATFAGRFPTAPGLLGPSGPLLFASISGFVSAQIAQANASAASATREFDAFLPKLGLKYDLTEDLSASFVVQRGYRSGGSSLNIARASLVEYEPEYTWNYEAALRSTWLGGKLRVNANAFYTDWEDQQVVVDLGLNIYDFQTENAGESHLYGFEIDVAHQLTPELSWYAGAGYTKTEFDDFSVSNGVVSTDLAGSEFAFAPRWTLAAGVDWVGANGMVANLNAHYRSDAYGRTGVATQATKDIDARTVFNGRIGYQAERWGAFVFGSNLFDEAYINYARKADNVAILGEPRVIGITLEARR
jgi:iron complex outermembrane recepter protein